MTDPGADTPILLPTGPFGTILIDYPWPTGKSKSGWMKNMSNRKYPTMTIRRGMGMAVGAIAKPDAVILMWATWGMINSAIMLMKAWGFQYSTGIPWLKVLKTSDREWGMFAEPSHHRFMPAPIFGPGVWFQHCSEVLLIGRRGRPFGNLGNPRPARKGIIIHPRMEPSRKPDDIHRWVEGEGIKLGKFPEPRVELFARRPRTGWTVWGNEV